MYKPRKVIVIGGGIIGICTAYYLWKAHHNVVVVEKSDIGQGCSYGNSGLIVPSHIVPLAAPGIVSEVLAQIFSIRSPFYIKPRLNYRFLAWLWHFYFSANNGHMLRSLDLLRDLNLFSRSLYHELYAGDHIAFPLEEKGVLMLYNTQRRADIELRIARLAEEHGLTVEILDQLEVSIRLGGIPVDVLGGVYYKQDANLNPHRFLQNMAHFLENQGVEILRYTEVIGFEERTRKLQGLITSEGEIFADDYVIATGSGSTDLFSKLDVDIPLESGKGYSFTIDDPPFIPDFPLLLTESRVAVSPMEEQLRFAGIMELAGQDFTLNTDRVSQVVSSVKEYLPLYKSVDEQSGQSWCGLRPCSPDGLPYIGRLKTMSNLIVATGHAMMGMSLGPVTGHLVADIVSGKTPVIDIKPFRPERFA